MPLILKGKDNDILSFLLKTDGFVFTSSDFSSFISQAIYERWTQGLRTFLYSNAVQFFFSSLTWEEQRSNIDYIIRAIFSIDEVNARNAYTTGIIEENLTKRPYVKHLTNILLSGQLAQSMDATKVARECLKNLTNEDFMQLSHMEGLNMMDFERAYQNIQGSAYENELAKIMLRYQNEGKSTNAYTN